MTHMDVLMSRKAGRRERPCEIAVEDGMQRKSDEFKSQGSEIYKNA